MVKCSCSVGKSILFYCCSGASNVGQIANAATVKLADMGIGAMTCAVALGSDKSGFVESARVADRNILIDGCPVSCVRDIFQRHGICNYEHHIVTEMGIIKGPRQGFGTPEVDLVVRTVNEKICKPIG